MRILRIALVITAATIAAWLIIRRRRSNVLHAKDASIPGGRSVTIEEEVPGEPRIRGKRTGENQELKRRLVHGEFRPIKDPGAPSSVEPNNSQS
ncbi:hypothetical protein [Flavihumibacter solisilvae]|uniref:Uncharacterized protein n=1 Tax=Flavihumibacter solisilvae TaxID=1349421 RepID=A0A0C1IJQ6_9BACT|nr:hypothetical protein [Flavihumibacter solisilvae]KIC94410.1 hypothetical protein OI18_12405 [Flavihumibacter solisilvae]